MQDKLLEIINTMNINKNRPLLKSISDNLHLRDDIGFDSLELAELTVRLENEFGIDIFEKGIVNTIGEVLERLSIN